MDKMGNVYKILVKNLHGRDHLEDSGMDGRIILICILKKLGIRVWTGFNWLRIGSRGRQLHKS
jgi:hypothetical protein